MNKLEDFLTPTQNQLFGTLGRLYEGKCEFKENGFILVRGEVPIMLLAHLDTVHKEPVKQICETQNGNILMSPQGIGGDDRCGVYALVTAYKIADKKPWLLFTCDEEIGGQGAEKFCDAHSKGELPKELDELKMLVEIDRKGSKSAVYYNCANDAFEEYITSKGFKTEYGSFSDISYVAPELGVAAVNLSSGYYNAHTLHEYINRKQLNITVKKVLGIIDDVSCPDFPKYEYVEVSRYYEYGRFDMHALDGIPENLKKAYLFLLDLYDFDELEMYRNSYGVRVIVDLYETECMDYSPVETPDANKSWWEE